MAMTDLLFRHSGDQLEITNDDSYALRNTRPVRRHSYDYRDNFNITLHVVVIAVLWIITELRTNAFSFGWALPSTGLIS